MNSLELRWQKIAAIVIAAVLVLGIGGFAVSRIAAASSLDSARGAAQLVVPQTAELLSESSTDDSYRFEFRDPDNKDDYRVVVDRRDKDQIQVRSINDERRGSEDILLNKEDVTALILETYPSATISSISLEKEDDAERYTYKALFSTDDVRGQFLVNPATGRVLERTMTFGPSVVLMDMSQSDDGTGLVPQDDAMLTLAEARVIALEAVPDGKLRKLFYSEDDASLTINVTMTRDDEQVDLVLDAVTGQVRRMDIGEDSIVTDPTGETPTQPELLGAQKVKEIVAKKAGKGATVDDPSLNHDNDRTYYQGKAFVPGREFEYNVDAYTGALTWWKETVTDITASTPTTPSTTTPTYPPTSPTTWDNDWDDNDWDNDDWDDDDWDDWDDDDWDDWDDDDWDDDDDD